MSDSTQTVGGGLDKDRWPEIGIGEGVEEQPKHRRTARHQVTFEPSHQITAGVVLQEWKPIPDRRRKQDEGARDGGTDTQHKKAFQPRLTFPLSYWPLAINLG